MDVYHTFSEIPRQEQTVLTIGTFDGVHLGHRKIIRTLLDTAQQIGGRSMVLTFHPHPQEVLRKTGTSVSILTTIDERIAELDKLGVDALGILEFTPAFAATPWQDFCWMLIREVGVGHIVVGHDHAFGKNREGNVESLKIFGTANGFSVTEVGPLLIDNEAVSSTKIRKALTEGDVGKAHSYMDRSYSLQGTVVRGDGRGKTLGFPTANIVPLTPKQLLPGRGVYCVSVKIGTEWHNGMANIGTRPTFTDDVTNTLEVHLFDFSRDIYTQIVRVEFRKFIRSEQIFGSKEEFLGQLQHDQQQCLDSFTDDSK